MVTSFKVSTLIYLYCLHYEGGTNYIHEVTS